MLQLFATRKYVKNSFGMKNNNIYQLVYKIHPFSSHFSPLKLLLSLSFSFILMKNCLPWPNTLTYKESLSLFFLFLFLSVHPFSLNCWNETKENICETIAHFYFSPLSRHCHINTQTQMFTTIVMMNE